VKVFISHSAADRPFAQRLEKALSEHGLEVWTAAQFQPGESWPAQLKSAIEQADAVIPIISAGAEKSRWMASELSIALADRLSGGKKTIVPVLAERKAEAPFFLKDLQWLDLSSEERFQGNIDVLIRALHRDRAAAPSQAEIIESRKELLRAGAKLLRDDMQALEKREALQMRFISRTLASVAVIATVAFLTLSISHGWMVLSTLSVGIGVLSFLAGAISAILTSVLRRRFRTRDNVQPVVGGKARE
jgi:hypothetical protein